MNSRSRLAWLQEGIEITPAPPQQNWLVTIQCSEFFWFPCWKVGGSEYHIYIFRDQRNPVEHWLGWLSLQGPVEFILRECMEAPTVQWNIPVAIWSISASPWDLEWSGERRKSGKSRSSHNWINKHKGRDTAILACARATGQGMQGEACLAEWATQMLPQHLNLVTP